MIVLRLVSVNLIYLVTLDFFKYSSIWTKLILWNGLIVCTEAIYRQAEEMKRSIGQDELLKLVNGTQEKVSVGKVTFCIENGMLIGQSSDHPGKTSVHCYITSVFEFWKSTAIKFLVILLLSGYKFNTIQFC